MKIYLDNNLGVSNVEQEELTQDTIGYNILKVYIPNAVLTPYNTFTCYYGALLQNGRKVGWFAMEARTSSDADYEAKYTLYKATLEQCIVSVEGKVYIGCQVLLGNSGNATLIKKNTAVVQFNVRKSVAINNDILVLDTDQTTTDVLESYKNLLEKALTTYATKATTYTKTEVDEKIDDISSYTKSEIDTMINAKADKTTVEGINTRVGALETDIANLKSVQNVVEVVATKSALNSYDTTKLDANDKVQVIADETHDGASTIYNWSGSAWQYVGAFGGNSYTKAETYNKTQIDSALSDKADKSNTYTRAVIDSMVLTLSTDKADKSDVYTKTEEDAKFEEVGQMFEIVGNEVLKKADKTELNNAINDLLWELGSHTLDVTTDTDTKYLKSVPSGALGCQINKVGGMSYKVNGAIQHSAVTEIRSKNGSTSVDSLSIPSYIRNIDGYGWGINDTCYNYIDFERKVFVRKVGRVDLGTLNYSRTQWGQNYVFQTILSMSNSNNLLCSIYDTANPNYIYANAVDKSITNNSNAENNLKIVDSAYSNATAFKSAMNGVYLYYELATPIETDISAYLTTDTLEVEPNGTLEFLNTYSQDVPSDIDYLIEEVKA